MNNAKSKAPGRALDEDAWGEGLNAYLAGASWIDCPYTFGSAERRAWQWGYRAAEADLAGAEDE